VKESKKQKNIKYKFPSPPIFKNLGDENLLINIKWPNQDAEVNRNKNARSRI
jgi:hypothetical protein